MECRKPISMAEKLIATPIPVIHDLQLKKMHNHYCMRKDHKDIACEIKCDDKCKVK